MKKFFSQTPRSTSVARFIRQTVLLSMLMMSAAQWAEAQISPGELSSAHAHLEGFSNCTECHTLGETISSDRCLACHGEIRSRLSAGSGLHGRNKYQQCIDCHKEHHGRNFSLRRIETKTFDHLLTGFALQGKHSNLECLKCHEEAKIKSSDIVEKAKAFKERTYLGLSVECAACHRDIHSGQLPSRCEQCHLVEGWKPASNFSHARAAYKLTGKHETVDCSGCHKKTLDHGTTVQYVHVEFAACSFCHSDPHKGKFNQSCQSCHSTAGWGEGSAKKFNHSLTQFSLRGKHASLKCEQCHLEAAKKGKTAAGSFAIAKFKNCSDCHADAHAEQFAHRSDQGKCESCHTEESFVPSRFSVLDHKQTRFELTSAHIATPCIACHTSGAVQAKSQRLFRWKEELHCITCHTDVHKGQFQSSPKKNCESCHTTIAWNSLTFTHETTRIPLRGKHAEILCTKCHTKSDAGLSGERIQYRASRPAGCSSCHKDEHEAQFAHNGATECERCHSPASWKISDFNHTLRTRYELSGKHTTVPCGKCHTPATINGRTIVRYKPLGTACADCHTTGEGYEKK